MSFTIYPAIDLRGGKVVRLKEGDPARMTEYSDDPVMTARHWLGAGARWLHVVNLDGAFGEGDNENRLVLQRILNAANEFGAHIQFGGGLRSLRAIQNAIKMGVSRVVLGTIAIEQPVVVGNALTIFGVERIAVGIDARDGIVHVQGWKDITGISANELALRMKHLGLHTVIYTDITRDGLGGGLNIHSACELSDISELDVIASGGVQIMDDVLAAREAKLAGVIIGRALYDGTIDLRETLRGAEDAS